MKLPEPIHKSSILPWEADFVPETAERGFPGVSIVIPIFNSGKFLEKTLRSLLCNDRSGIELIVMDGGSTDNTSQILDHYREFFAVCVSEKDKGQSDAINKGFKHATQPVLHWLNGDDILLPNALYHVRKKFHEDKAAQVVVGNAYMTEADFSPIRHFRFSEEKLRFEHLLDYALNHLVQPSVFFTKKAWAACGPVAENLHYAMDADLFLAMAGKYEFRHLPVDLAYSVYHEDCKTRDKRAESISELALVQSMHGGFSQARATLNLLVDMYNKLESGEQPGIRVQNCEHCELTDRKLKAYIEEVERNRQALLETDIRETLNT